MAMSPALGWIRAVAIFDLLATAPMAVPVLGDWYAALLFTNLGLSGAPSTLMPMPAVASLFIVLAGVLAVLWNGCRAWHPELLALTRFDVAGRCAVAALLLYFLLGVGVPAMLWLFVATELLGAAVEWTALRAMRQA